MSKIFWYFPSTGHGENHGFQDPLLQYFQGDHENYIAREAIQNAVDARLDYDKPVSVVFEKTAILNSSFPGYSELLDKLHRCLVFVKGQDKAEPFFKSAIALLKGKNLPVLKISDFNTRGLSGSDDDVDGNWHRLVRAAGTSSLKGAGGGSFGIGKGAPIVASALRTVFYSSINDKDELVFQGKARLVSHHDDERDVRQGIGFYGVEGYKALRNDALVPDFFKRSERGTDIYVMGYKTGADWKGKLIKSVLHNFWLAIYNGDLEVSIRDGSELTITKSNLRKYLDDYDAEDAKFYFEAVTNWTKDFHVELKHLGKVSLYVRKQDNYPSRVMMARKPRMLVAEKQYRSLREPYAAVFICDNDKGNALLRDLEPPAHDKWNRDLADNGKIIMRELDEFIKEKLKSMGEDITSEPQDIPGLARYLPDNEEREYLSLTEAEAVDPTELNTDEETGHEIGAEKELASADIETIVRKGIVTTKENKPVGPTPPVGPGNGPSGRATGPEEGTKEGARIKTSAISFRSFVQKGKAGFEYHLAITGREDCEGAIRLVAVGDEGSYPVELKSVAEEKSGTSYDTSESMIKGLSIENGKTLKLIVLLASPKKYALAIENYEG
ncbi:hypothetical protein A2763_02915 [Candidatus Kaiserbacteria bacterium RIFCSPHIGHO2_01_FULL_54_36]|uniref:Uncharacterized protein n=1 Tax=Candidatus Kaiserbacteria bacterium RIFCSPHIGHO2_01_FULL_54_36 TaxID=1798482 RepID=A0A1F6CP80_9BACT|nr:MAG: hypothetical protein A2763_02915 [Candidatus Kaiserbacteria bacterium RIFCSPHIGHO2_01_FULL_54_36]